jgi:hypothetical protein
MKPLFRLLFLITSIIGGPPLYGQTDKLLNNIDSVMTGHEVVGPGISGPANYAAHADVTQIFDQ